MKEELDNASVEMGFGFIPTTIDTFNGFGRTCARRFVEEANFPGERSPKQGQQDAFGQFDACLRALRLRR